MSSNPIAHEDAVQLFAFVLVAYGDEHLSDALVRVRALIEAYGLDHDAIIADAVEIVRQS